MDELPLSQVDADMRNAAVGIEEDQVAAAGTTDGRTADVVLRVGCAGQPMPINARRRAATKPEQSKPDVLVPPKDVGYTQKPQRARGKLRRDPRGPGQDAAGKAADPVRWC